MHTAISPTSIPNMMLEFYAHSNGQKIHPESYRIDIRFGTVYLIEVDPYPQALFIRRAARYETGLLDRPDNCYHSAVWLDGETVKIRDLSSLEGTHVNGVNIGKDECALKDGDEICFGCLPTTPTPTSDRIHQNPSERVIVHVKVTLPRFPDAPRTSCASLDDLRESKEQFCNTQ